MQYRECNIDFKSYIQLVLNILLYVVVMLLTVAMRNYAGGWSQTICLFHMCRKRSLLEIADMWKVENVSLGLAVVRRYLSLSPEYPASSSWTRGKGVLPSHLQQQDICQNACVKLMRCHGIAALFGWKGATVPQNGNMLHVSGSILSIWTCSWSNT